MANDPRIINALNKTGRLLIGLASSAGRLASPTIDDLANYVQMGGSADRMLKDMAETWAARVRLELHHELARRTESNYTYDPTKEN